MSNYTTPGVYIEEIPSLPPIVSPVSTAIPAFIGYTEKRPGSAAGVVIRRIRSMVEYDELFGKAYDGDVIYNTTTASAPASNKPKFSLFYQLQMFYANGGGPCYIVSVGTYSGNPTDTELANGLNALASEDEPTLILIPDAAGISNASDYYGLFKTALKQCAELKDRFTLLDLHSEDDKAGFRTDIGSNHLSYGAAYYPNLETTLRYYYDEKKEIAGGKKLRDDDDTENSLFHTDNKAYNEIRAKLEGLRVVLPPSGAIAGVYAQVDNNRGVFKAPANVSLNAVIRPMKKISAAEQGEENAHETGKAINAIRTFAGKGVMVWGARTLDANSSEWRYVNVRRFFNFTEESVSKTIDRFVFEPNTENTWVRVKASIENFLTNQWLAGAMAGSTPEQAFFVRVGLGQTMSPQDVLEGRLVVVVGMAVVRPAEFIILRFMHKLQEA